MPDEAAKYEETSRICVKAGLSELRARRRQHVRYKAKVIFTCMSIFRKLTILDVIYTSPLASTPD